MTVPNLWNIDFPALFDVPRHTFGELPRATEPSARADPDAFGMGMDGGGDGGEGSWTPDEPSWD